jgi:tripartite-type tricarboxylate transporter receptor subunit TctC
VGATERSSAFPDLPTVAEAGVPGYEMFAWFGVLAPAGTPQPVIDSLYKQMASTLTTPQVKERFAKLGADPVGSRPDQFGAFIQSEVAKWAKVIKAAGLKID